MNTVYSPAANVRTENPFSVVQMFVVVGVSALLAVFLTTRLSITADPRMILQPWLLNQGFVPYLQIADEHSPLLPQLLAWLQLLVGHDGILALRIAHAATLTLLFAVLTGWLWHRYGLWAMVAGFAFAWAFAVRFGLTTFWYNLALAPLFFGYFILLGNVSSHSLPQRIFWAGVLMGVGVLLKQQALVLAPAFVAWIGITHWRQSMQWRLLLRQFLSFSVGAVAPLLLYLVYYLTSGGDLAALIEWTVWFNLTSGYAKIGFLLPTNLDLLAILPAFLLTMPFVASIIAPAQLPTEERKVRLWLLICAISSLVFLYPRYSVPHWAVAFGFVAAMSAITCADIVRLAAAAPSPGARSMQILTASFLVYWMVYGAFLLWPALSGANQPRLLKFDESQELALMLADKLPADSTIVFIPDNEAVSNAYYALQRTPPRFWMMHYPWFMQPDVRERWLAELSSNPPDYVVWVEGLQDLDTTGPEIAPFVNAQFVEIENMEWQGRSVRLLQRNQVEAQE